MQPFTAILLNIYEISRKRPGVCVRYFRLDVVSRLNERTGGRAKSLILKKTSLTGEREESRDEWEKLESVI